MKKITTLFVLLTAVVLGAMAQATVLPTVYAARFPTTATGAPQDSGMIIQVTGTVYGPNSYPTANGMVFWLNDGTAGIKVYSKHKYAGYTTLTDGDSVVVAGRLSSFYGSAEIDLSDTAAFDTIYKVSSGTPSAPMVITAGGFSVYTYGTLVQVNNVNMNTATRWAKVANTNGVGFKTHFTAIAGTLYLYIDSFINANLYNSAQPQGIYNIIGIGDDYSPTQFNLDPRSIADFIRVDTATGIAALDNLITAAVYPNPASTQLNVMVPNEKDETMTVRMFDVTGKMVLSENRELTSGANEMQFNTANFNNGMYILELRTADRYMNTKIVVAK